MSDTKEELRKAQRTAVLSMVSTLRLIHSEHPDMRLALKALERWLTENDK